MTNLKRYIFSAAMMLAASQASAKFIIVPPEGKVTAAPIEVRGQQPAELEKRHYSKISRISQPLIETGKPIDRPFAPEVYASKIKLQYILPELLPNELAIYVHDTVGANRDVAFVSEGETDWRDAAARFAYENQLSLVLDWDQRIAEVLPNGSSIQDSPAEDTTIVDPEGRKYVIRTVEQDQRVTNSAGYLLVDGKIVRFDAAE